MHLRPYLSLVLMECNVSMTCQWLNQLAPGAIPAVGVEARLTHVFSLEDTRAFAQLSGDNNPLHVDAEFARKVAAKSKPLVQGLLSASLFAAIFGRTVPGAVYVKQDLS